MSIEVNSKPMDWIEDETIKQLLKRMNYTFPLVVVKIDSQVIPKAKYSETIIPDNSNVEVIHLISGG
ncbi:MAG: sulfur carrier protein ThiS [Thermoplasmata archaeon]|nr:sulfur carrier protein ThiS [Thermoplasmata archaeon]